MLDLCIHLVIYLWLVVVEVVVAYFKVVSRHLSAGTEEKLRKP
jgi:hypothetical protein